MFSFLGIQQYSVLSDKSGYETKKKSFRCEVCIESFLTEGSLLQHMFTHDVAQSFKCAFRKSKFTQQSQLNEHIELNHKLSINSEKDKCTRQVIATNSAVANGFVPLDDGSNDTVIIDRVCISETETSCEKPRKHRRKRNSFRARFGPALESVSTEKVKGTAASSRFQCDLCQKKFKDRSYLYGHQVYNHRKPSQHQCHICNKYLPTAQSLLLHTKSHESTTDFLCHVCNRRFSTKEDLTTHSKFHYAQRPFLCQTCGRCFTTKCNLNIHMRVHTGKSPHRCKVCGKTFTKGDTLKAHTRIHSDERPYHCKTCEMSFRSRTNLRTHTRIHTGERPFMCDICCKSFTQKNHMITHMKVHIGQMTAR